MRILLVDDDANTRTAMRSLLAWEGYVIDACENARQALEHLNLRRYRTLLTDMVMPEVDGLTLIRAARGLQPDLHCYIVSGAANPVPGDPDIRAWLAKPLDIDALLAFLRAPL